MTSLSIVSRLSRTGSDALLDLSSSARPAYGPVVPLHMIREMTESEVMEAWPVGHMAIDRGGRIREIVSNDGITIRWRRQFSNTVYKGWYVNFARHVKPPMKPMQGAQNAEAENPLREPRR